MSKYVFGRYKIKLDATSKKVQGLRVGDVVRRQYFDYPNLIYSLMVVLEIGFDNVVVNGVTKQSHYFIGALMDGNEPESGQLLDFVRVTNLFDNDRGGALYLTASDDQAPYLDVVDGMATENTLCYPFMIGGVGDIANINKYACVGESYVTQEYFKSSEDSYRVFKLTKNNTPLGPSNNISIKQSISQTLKNPQRVLISFKHRGSKEAQGIPMSFGYTSGEQMDGVDSFDCATTWKYHFSAITIDYPEQYQRSFEVDLTNYLTSENDWFEMSDLNIVLLSDIGNFGKSTKTRIGKLNGILDPVFGNIDGYGAFFQKMYATKNVNIAGTLTAGDEKGFASTFYVGKIHKNCLINSLYGNFSGIVNIVGNEQSPSGIGKVFELTSGSATIIAQSEEWTNNNKDKKYCFSFWAKANNVGTFNVKTNINENTDFTIDTPNSWRRYCVPFTIKNISGYGCEITILSQDSTFMFSSAQLESGDHSTLYQPTDSVLSDVDGYGAWFNRGGIGGTIQNPLLKLDQDGSIRSNNGSFVINNDGTGYFSNGAIKWFVDRVELAENVKLKWINLDPETRFNLKGDPGVDANLLDWVSEWNTNKTMISDSLVVTPKIFSGSILNGFLNGVAVGNYSVTYVNSSGNNELYNVNGIAGFSNGRRFFKIDEFGGEIGGWSLDYDSIYLGSKNNTKRAFANSIGEITVGSLGIRGMSWYLDADGYIMFGKNANSISYDPLLGELLFGSEVKLGWGNIEVSEGQIDGTLITEKSITSSHIKTETITALGKVTAAEFEIKDDTGEVAYSVSRLGFLKAKNAEISGKISSNNGQIACWTIDQDSLYLGEKANIEGLFASKIGDITIGSKGIRSFGYYLDYDGSFCFGDNSSIGDKSFIEYSKSKGILLGENVKLSRKNGDSVISVDLDNIDTDVNKNRNAILSRMASLGGESTFTESALVIDVLMVEQNTYKLTIDSSIGFSEFHINDVIYGDINNFFENKNRVKFWGRVQAVDLPAGEILVVKYSDVEVPGGQNYDPTPGMNITRRGNATDETRQMGWYISSYENAFMFLSGVTKPILEEYNYALSIGIPKRLELFHNLPIDYNSPYLYAKGAILQDIYSIDYNGVPRYERSDKGLWDASTSYIMGYNNETKKYEQHEVWHESGLWRCVVPQSTVGLPPKHNNTEWVCILGDKNFTIEIQSSNGKVFRANSVNTVLSAIIKHGTMDITEDILMWVWTRDSGLLMEDNLWAIEHSQSESSIQITQMDMSSNWLDKRKVSFKVTATIPSTNKLIEQQFTIN